MSKQKLLEEAKEILVVLKAGSKNPRLWEQDLREIKEKWEKIDIEIDKEFKQICEVVGI